MSIYIILVNNGYAFENGMYSETIVAKSAQEARKIFLERNAGAWYAYAANIKAKKLG